MYQKRNIELEIIGLYLGDYKTRLYLRQISRLSRQPLKTCQTALKILEKNSVLKGKIEGRNKYFSLNLENIYVKSLLLQAEIRKTDLLLEKYPQFKIFIKSLKTNTPIIVFGSFARFKSDKNSDIDILIVSEKEGLPLHLLPNKTHEINLPESSYIKALKQNETLIKEIEENHVILNNHSFYVNVMWEYYAR